MSIPKPEKSWTWGNVVTGGVASATLLTLLLGGAARMIGADANAAAVPQLRSDISNNRQDIATLRNDVNNLKERRAEDTQAVSGMRGEIIGRLERIETKLDNKADKTAQPQGWTR